MRRVLGALEKERCDLLLMMMTFVDTSGTSEIREQGSSFRETLVCTATIRNRLGRWNEIMGEYLGIVWHEFEPVYDARDEYD